MYKSVSVGLGKIDATDITWNTCQYCTLGIGIWNFVMRQTTLIKNRYCIHFGWLELLVLVHKYCCSIHTILYTL